MHIACRGAWVCFIYQPDASAIKGMVGTHGFFCISTNKWKCYTNKHASKEETLNKTIVKSKCFRALESLDENKLTCDSDVNWYAGFLKCWTDTLCDNTMLQSMHWINITATTEKQV